MRIIILSTFPEYFASALQASIVGRAISNNHVEILPIQLRDFTVDGHRTTDDRPYGGGAGMVMMVEPIDRALQATTKLRKGSHRSILLSARGKRLDQSAVTRLAAYQSITLICGHYGDVDQRVADRLVDEEISVGDFVLTGGEPAALVLIDAVVRLLPGVLGNDQSLQNESHAEPGRVSAPSYTRPQVYGKWKVPEVLLNGDHAEITKWKAKNSG